MGSGIAQVASTADCIVKIYDMNVEALKKSEAELERILSRLIEKGRINNDEKEKIQSNIDYVDTLTGLRDSDLIIEAIVENLEVKKVVFQELELLVSENCIIASNTSSLSIASIASSLKKPERCIGIHFFNPAPLMKLVEVIPAVQTSEMVLQSSIDTLRKWNKIVAVAKDTPGFIVNRVARPFYGEALRIYEEGIADFSTIDWAMRSKGAFKMGPFELMDFIGNDVNYAVTESVFTAFYFDPRYKPSFTQKRYSEAGFLGRKSGRGYYKYDEGIAKITPNEDNALGDQIFERILIMLINEAADAVFWGIASVQDIDNAMKNGVNYPMGLLAWADQLGIDWCVSKMDALYDQYREDRYRCSPILKKMSEANRTFYS